MHNGIPLEIVGHIHIRRGKEAKHFAFSIHNRRIHSVDALAAITLAEDAEAPVVEHYLIIGIAVHPASHYHPVENLRSSGHKPPSVRAEEGDIGHSIVGDTAQNQHSLAGGQIIRRRDIAQTALQHIANGIGLVRHHSARIYFIPVIDKGNADYGQGRHRNAERYHQHNGNHSLEIMLFVCLFPFSSLREKAKDEIEHHRYHDNGKCVAQITVVDSGNHNILLFSYRIDIVYISAGREMAEFPACKLLFQVGSQFARIGIDSLVVLPFIALVFGIAEKRRNHILPVLRGKHRLEGIPVAHILWLQAYV